MTWMKLAETQNFEIPNGTTVDLTALAGNYTEGMGWHKPESVKDLTVGQVAFVWSYGDWKRGVVTKIGRTKATVTFVTRTGVENALAGTGWGRGAQLKVTAKAEGVDGLLVTTDPVMTVPSISQGAAPAPVVAEVEAEDPAQYVVSPEHTPDPVTGRIPALEVEAPVQRDPRDDYFTKGCGADVVKRDQELIPGPVVCCDRGPVGHSREDCPAGLEDPEAAPALPDVPEFAGAHMFRPNGKNWLGVVESGRCAYPDCGAGEVSPVHVTRPYLLGLSTQAAPAEAPTPANHVLIDPQGVQVKEGDALPGHNFGPGVFRGITRVPGDGTSTGGKILADWERWAGKEGYPPPGYRIVPAWTLNQTQEDVDALLAEALGEDGEDPDCLAQDHLAGPEGLECRRCGAEMDAPEEDPAPAGYVDLGVTSGGTPVLVAPMGTPEPTAEDLSDLALEMASQELAETPDPELPPPPPALPRCQVGDVVTIHRGDRLYEVLQVDDPGLSMGVPSARVAPCDPEDHRDPRWVSMDLLHVRTPVARVATEELALRLRQTQETFVLPDGSLALIRTVLSDSRRAAYAILVSWLDVVALFADPVAKLRVGEAVVVDGRCFRVVDPEGTGRLTLEPARWRDRFAD